jgi:hypothetical protein
MTFNNHASTLIILFQEKQIHISQVNKQTHRLGHAVNLNKENISWEDKKKIYSLVDILVNKTQN